MSDLPAEKQTNQKLTAVAKEINIAILKKQTDANIKSLIYAGTNDVKVELLNTMKKTLSPDKFKEVLKTAYGNKIISEDVIKRINIK